MLPVCRSESTNVLSQEADTILTDRQTNRYRYRDTDRQMQTDRERGRRTQLQTDMDTDRQKQSERETDRKIQRDRQTWCIMELYIT